MEIGDASERTPNQFLRAICSEYKRFVLVSGVRVPFICRASRFAFYLRAVVTCVVLILTQSAYAYTRNYSPNAGYVSDIEGERGARVNDMVIIPAPAEGKMIKDKIFDDRISKEFTEKYSEQFGLTEAEQSYYATNQYTYYNEQFGEGGSVKDVSNERRRFGEYMLRRLAEYHSQQFAQTDPSMHAVWQAKERYSKMDVDVSSFKFSSAYDISSNTVDLKVKNHFVDSRWQVQMRGVNNVRESTFSLSRALSEKLTLESHYTMVDGIVAVLARKQLTPQMNASLIASTYTNLTGTSTRETLYLAGWGLIF